MNNKNYSKEEIIFLQNFIKPDGSIPNYQNCEETVKPAYMQRFQIARASGSLYMMLWRIANGYYDKKTA